MDPFDAVREQLKGAQTRGLDAVRDRLQSVLEALDQARSAVQGVMSEPADQLLPMADVEASVASLRGAPPAAAGITLDLIRRLDAARSQSELLHELMSILTGFAARAVVLVIRSGEASAWSGVGFERGTALEQWRGEVSASGVLSSMVREPKPVRFGPVDDPLFSRWFVGSTPPDEGLLVPVSLRGKLMGAVYADRLAGNPWDPDAVQALVAMGCWLIDTLHHRTEMPTPMLAEATMVEAAAVAPEPTVPEPAPPVAAPPDEFAVEEEVPVSVEPPEPVVPYEPDVEPAVAEPPGADLPEFEVAEPTPAEEPELEEVVAPDFDPSATVQVDLDEVAEEMEVAETPPSEELEFDVGAEAVAESPAGAEVEAPELVEPPPVEPPSVEPVVPPRDAGVEVEAGAEEAAPALTAEEETRHEEARRFARLLVSEIKLYNEDDVDRGRVNRDLYQRLKEDIDRSREMYEKRISPDIRATRDYFHEELVRILADGDPDVLGM